MKPPGVYSLSERVFQMLYPAFFDRRWPDSSSFGSRIRPELFPAVIHLYRNHIESKLAFPQGGIAGTGSQPHLGHPAKLALAVRLRAQTTMTVAWIVHRLRMGTPSYLNLLLYRQRRTQA